MIYPEYLQFANKVRKCVLNSFVLRIIDKNGDKYLDANELVKLLTSLGDTLSKDEAEAMIRVADINKDGKIDYEGIGFIILCLVNLL